MKLFVQLINLALNHWIKLQIQTEPSMEACRPSEHAQWSELVSPSKFRLHDVVLGQADRRPILCEKAVLQVDPRWADFFVSNIQFSTWSEPCFGRSIYWATINLTTKTYAWCMQTYIVRILEAKHDFLFLIFLKPCKHVSWLLSDSYVHKIQVNRNREIEKQKPIKK